MDVVIDHNPACGASRHALTAIRAGGIDPCIVGSLARPPTQVRDLRPARPGRPAAAKTGRAGGSRRIATA